MKGRLVFSLGVLLVFSVMYGGCKTISGQVEAALGFPRPISINKLIVGSFTYNINDTYLARPDGSCFNKKDLDESSDAEPENEYHVASYDELYLWAVRSAAEKAKITNIIAIKSFITTTMTYFIGFASGRQDVTVTVYGESP